VNPALNLRDVPVDKTRMTDGTHNHKSRIASPSIFCRSCGSPLVQATDWEEQEESHWAVQLWCPECSFEQAAVLDRPQLLYLSLAVEEGFGWMLEALAELSALDAIPADLDFAHRVRTDRIQPAGH